MNRKQKSLSHFLDLNTLWNRKTLVIGEVGSGKTFYTEQILKKMIESGESSMAVIDMAPEARNRVGGKMDVSGLEGVVYYTDHINAPRLTGRTPEEVFRLASENASRIERLLEKYQQNPSKILIINDVSIYLQAGDLEKLWALVDHSPTVLMNGYYGESLGQEELSRRERHNMELLRDRCDYVLLLEPDT